MTVQFSFTRNHGLFNCIPTFRSPRWVEVVSTLQGTLAPAVSAIWELPTCALACVPLPRRWLLLQNREAWRMFPELLLLPPGEADAPCSASTDLCSLSSLTLSFPDHDSSFALREVCRKFCMLHVAKIHEGCNMNRSSIIFARRITSALNFSFVEVHSQRVLKLVTFFVGGGLFCWNFHRLFDGDGYVHQLWNSDRYSFSAIRSHFSFVFPNVLCFCWWLQLQV